MIPWRLRTLRWCAPSISRGVESFAVLEAARPNALEEAVDGF
jgi:hypothetical protein